MADFGLYVKHSQLLRSALSMDVEVCAGDFPISDFLDSDNGESVNVTLTVEDVVEVLAFLQKEQARLVDQHIYVPGASNGGPCAYSFEGIDRVTRRCLIAPQRHAYFDFPGVD